MVDVKYIRDAVQSNIPRDDLTDNELATKMRYNIIELNQLAELAAKRELIVAYRIKEGIKTDGFTNPRIIVSVMTEVA
jgi:hypothetical protein